MQGSKHSKNSEEQQRGRENATETSHVEALKGNVLMHPLFIQQPGTDEKAADCKKKVDTQCAETVWNGVGNRAEVMDTVMKGNYGKNCDCSPAVQRRDIAIFHGKLQDVLLESVNIQISCSIARFME